MNFSIESLKLKYLILMKRKKMNNSQLDKLFFTSDTHYGHSSVIGFCNRPYINVQEMNNDLIKRFNSVVPSDGTCIWVGDCFFNGKEQAREIMKQLNGTHICIRGNHDGKHASMYNLGFSFVCDYAEMIIGGKDVKIKHFPSKYSSNNLLNYIRLEILAKYFRKWWKIVKPRYFDRYPDPDGRWLIHGHTHSTEKINEKLKSIHIGVDAWDYYPVPYRLIEQIVQKGSMPEVKGKKKDAIRIPKA